MSFNAMPKTPSAVNSMNDGPSRWVASINVWSVTQTPAIYKINGVKNEFQK